MTNTLNGATLTWTGGIGWEIGPIEAASLS